MKEPNTFEIDKEIQYYGYSSLKIPPNHYHPYPVELVWAKIKERKTKEKESLKNHGHRKEEN